MKQNILLKLLIYERFNIRLLLSILSSEKLNNLWAKINGNVSKVNLSL